MRKVVLAAPLALFGTSVFAAVPEAITTELGTARTDALTIGAAVLAIIVAMFALKIVRRAL